MVTPPPNFRDTSGLNSFLMSSTDLKGRGPFQHRGSAGSGTSLRDLLRDAFSCNILHMSWYISGHSECVVTCDLELTVETS